MRTLQCWNNTSRKRNVIVFDENTIGKIETMVLPAAATHRVFIDHPQPGKSFARVKNSCLRPRDCIDEFPSQCSNAAHALQQIQNYALAGKNEAGVVPNDSD